MKVERNREIKIESEENNEVLIRIKCLLEERSWSIYKLAKESKIPYSSINNLFIRNTQPTVTTLEKICNGFDITLSDFFQYRNLYPKNNAFSTEERELIALYQSLNRRDKQLLLAYLAGLAKQEKCCYDCNKRMKK
ncbi:MAG: helix-turn-helix transcriptional regulator [Lachnospiraceae bacterium]